MHCIWCCLATSLLKRLRAQTTIGCRFPFDQKFRSEFQEISTVLANEKFSGMSNIMDKPAGYTQIFQSCRSFLFYFTLHFSNVTILRFSRKLSQDILVEVSFPELFCRINGKRPVYRHKRCVFPQQYRDREILRIKLIKSLYFKMTRQKILLKKSLYIYIYIRLVIKFLIFYRTEPTKKRENTSNIIYYQLSSSIKLIFVASLTTSLKI